MFHFDIDFADKNGERYMLPIRIQKLLELLRERAFLCRVPLDGIERLDGKFSPSTAKTACGWRSFSPERDHWGGKDSYIWFRHSFEIPESMNGKCVYYRVEAGDSDYWQWANPQLCVFLNGKTFVGMDSNHRTFLLTDAACAGDRADVLVSGYTDTIYYERPVRFRPFLEAIEPETMALYYDLKVAYEVAHELGTDDVERVDLIHAVNAAFNLLELNEEDPTRFLESVRAAREEIKKNAYGNHRENAPVIAAVGSTHIDVAWLWRYEQTREKARRSFATAVRLLERNPDFIFMCSQPQLYSFVKQDDPELYEQVKHWVRLGRWEPEGGMWVEADTNLSSGESLIRQFLVGKRFFMEEFGADNKVLWLPDVFGYSAALPQIMKKCGVDYFMTTKISWNEFNKLPYDTFYWRGIDGSKVLAHFIPTKERVQAEKDWMTTYNGVLNPSSVMGAWQRYQQKDLNREVLASFGHGDGGGGTSQEMLEYGKRMGEGLPGCPTVRFTKVRDFFDRLEREVGDNPKTPVWDGELYFEYHRGTYTSVAGIKRRNRKNEIRTQEAENLAALSGVLFGDLTTAYPAESLNESWKLLLLNQFHDVLPGSSIGPVYEDAYAHHEVIEHIANTISKKAIERISAAVSADSESLIVFNTLGFARSAPVRFTPQTDGAFGLAVGDSVVPCVRQPDGTMLGFVTDVPAKGWKSFRIVPCEAASEPSANIRRLENADCCVEFDRQMNITRYYCKRTHRELLPQGALGGRLVAFDDNPRVDDAWNLMAYYEEKYQYIDTLDSAELLEQNALRSVIRVQRSFRKSKIRLDYILWRDQPGLTIEAELDWKEKDTLLKMEFPVDVNAVKATYDIQFGNLERPIHRNTLWDFARFEVCAHKWVDLSDNSMGLTFLNDCKYGYDVSHGRIRLSILRSATYPNPGQDKCRHIFSCKLLPHDGPIDLAEATRAGYDFNVPLHGFVVPAQKGVLPREKSFIVTDRKNVMIETVKRAENGNGVVLRVFECANRYDEVKLSLGFEAKELWLCDMLEQKQERIAVTNGTATLKIHPYEIMTLLAIV